MRLVAMASSSFFAFRKEARKTTSRTLLISAGSNTIGPTPTHRRAPLMVRPIPGAIGKSRNATPASPIV